MFWFCDKNKLLKMIINPFGYLDGLDDLIYLDYPDNLELKP